MYNQYQYKMWKQSFLEYTRNHTASGGTYYGYEVAKAIKLILKLKFNLMAGLRNV